jgi:SulP family sulfate permease
MVLLRLIGPLDFATFEAVRARLTAVLDERPEASVVVLAIHSVPRVDAIGAEELADQIEHLRSRGYRVAVSGPVEPVLEVLERTGVRERIGDENLFPTQLQAVTALWSDAHSGSDEEGCPLEGLPAAS